MKIIQGKVVYQNIGPGFWGIIDQLGGEWRPVNLPEQLKKEGKSIRVTIQETGEEMSVFMWGKAVRIVGFHT